MSTPEQAGPAGPAPGRGPLISVVLPVSGVEDYLGECLDSVLGQPAASGQRAAGIEVIAVDDASPDRCGAILDARAGRDPRLRVIHLATSVGPGPARTSGLAHASGDYVWFVDPDDLLTPGSLAAVTGKLADTGPDLLLIDYLSLREGGRTEPSPGAALLRAPVGPAEDETITLAERPALVNRTMTAWSKVFRRSFLSDLGVAFPPGVHEDVPVTCAALLSARRIALLADVCYLYRRRRRSFLATRSMGHFAIFSAYAQVFALMDTDDGAPGRPQVTPAVRVAVFGRAMEHYTTVLSSGLIPRRARRAYFARMASDFRRYRPAGYEPPPGVRGMKLRLVGRGAYTAYTILEPLNRIRVAVRRASRRVRPAEPAPVQGHGMVK